MDVESEGLRALYVASYSRLVGIVALVANDPSDAEEVVQDAFVRLIDHWPKVSRYDDPEAWVRSVAFRLLSNRFRKARNGRAALARTVPAGPATGPGADAVDVAAALAQLPLVQRQVVVLHYLLDLDVTTVAAQLEIPAGTVKSRLSRARVALHPLLEQCRA
jgi:RNA polymerase sigma-70 factor (ECF subfamily)